MEPQERAPTTPARHYRICVEGQLGPGWSEWFTGMTLHHTEAGNTVLSGLVVDQAALHGLLARIRDLNLTLLTVEQVEPERPLTSEPRP